MGISASGTVSASLFSGSGASLTNLNPGNLSQDGATTGQVLGWSGSVWTPSSVIFPVASVFGRGGAVTATTGDYTVSQITGAAPLASPAFTGTPSAPTATAGTNTTQVATTAFVQTAVGATAAVTFIKDSSNGALPNNKISAWIGNNSTGDGAGTETQFEFLMGETVTYSKFFCKLSVNTVAGQTVTFQAFDSSGSAIAGLTCVIPANSSTGTASGTSITLNSNTLYAVKATASTGNMNGDLAWWTIGQ